MKKRMAWLLCLVMMTGFAQAQQRTPKAKQTALGRKIEAKLSNARFERSLQVTLRLTYKRYDNDYGHALVDTRETICSAVFINPQGDLAIKNDCEEPLLDPTRYSNLQLVADMDNLGHGADKFNLWCEVENVNPKFIRNKGEFFTFPLRQHIPIPATKKLESLFREQGVKNLSNETLVRILSQMPPAKTTVWQTHE